jgi:putative restriction endonuclease
MSEHDDFLEQLSRLRINTDKTVQRRAPHKPLLLLLYLGLLQTGKERLHPYIEIEPFMFEGLRRFGPQRKQIHPEYPFWALTNDGICEVKHRGSLTKKKNENKPTRTSLVNAQAVGGFVTRVYFLLREDRALQSAVAHQLLDEHFPVSLHEDLLAFFGLKLPPPLPSSPDYGVGLGLREAVLKAYGYKCSISGFSVGATGSPGLEATLLCWRQVGGHADITNAIITTTTYRKLFDLGLLTLDDECNVKVATNVMEDPMTSSDIKKLNGKKLHLPNDSAACPSLSNIRWHQKEVFKS